MTEAVIVAVISLIGTGLGSLFGILKANQLTNYRIEQLEKKVEQHNQLSDRMIIAEQSVKAVHKRIDELEERLGA